MRICTKREVTKEEFEAALAAHPEAPLRFDGMRYTHAVPMGQGGRRTTIWNKPVAYIQGGKFFLIEDK